VTLTWIQTNGQSSVLISRDGAIVTTVTIDASAQGIDQILWMMRPSMLLNGTDDLALTFCAPIS
jgi:RNA polymerase sigma-70 factor (ECF subfamily)